MMKQFNAQPDHFVPGRSIVIDFSRFHGYPSIPGYTISKELGRGGMSTVYEASDNQGSQVALKVSPNYSRQMNAELSHLDDWFMRECAATLSVSHPNVIRGNGWGETENHIFLSLEALSGNTLDFFLRMGGKLQWKEAKELFIEVCKGLQAIHDAGIVHRDIKPENIFVIRRSSTSSGKIIDLGLCFMAGFGEVRQSPDESSVRIRDIGISGAGTLFGTPEYMPPEAGNERMNREPAFDIYALGLTMYQSVCGGLPFDTFETLEGKARVMKILEIKRNFSFPSPREFLPKRKMPKAAEKVIMRAIEKDPSRRFSSAEEMGRAIEAC